MLIAPAIVCLGLNGGRVWSLRCSRELEELEEQEVTDR